MKKLLLAILVVAGFATQEAEALFWRRGCKDGSCNRTETVVRERKGRRSGRCCKPRNCGTSRCEVACKPCESKVYFEPQAERCFTEEYCRMVKPEETIVIPAEYEKVTCTKRISDCCKVQTRACTAEEAANAVPLNEAPGKVQSMVSKAQPVSKVQATK